MHARRRWRIACLCLELRAGLLGPSPLLALPAEAPTEQPRQRAWSFGEGRVEVGVQVGGGVSLEHEPRSAGVFAVMPRLGYVFSELEHGLPGSFEIVAQPSYLTVFQQDTAHVGGVAALLKYNFLTKSAARRDQFQLHLPGRTWPPVRDQRSPRPELRVAVSPPVEH